MGYDLADSPVEVVKGLFYRDEIFIFAGAAGSGKSRMNLSMINKLSLGEPGWWGQPNPVRVLMCSQRSWCFNSQQLRSVGVPSLNENLRFFCFRDLSRNEKQSFAMDPLGFTKQRCFTADWKPDLVILDTLYHFFRKREHINFSDYNTMCAEMETIGDWASKEHVAVNAIHHASKQREGNQNQNPMERILGSVAILAYATAAAVIEPVQGNDSTIMVHFMSHMEKLLSARYFDTSDYHETSYADAVLPTPNLGTAENRVYSVLTEEWMETAAVVAVCEEKFQMGRTQVYNIIRTLKGKGAVIVDNLGDEGKQRVKRAKPS